MSENLILRRKVNIKFGDFFPLQNLIWELFLTIEIFH